MADSKEIMATGRRKCAIAVVKLVKGKGRVFVNGSPAKPAKQLKVGDIIEIEYANRTEKYEIQIVPDGNVSIQEASTLYKTLG
jgi:ribosomal 50S subunit-recycling heat shock protein